MIISLLNLVSSFFFESVNSFWWMIFGVTFLGLICVPIRLSLRRY